MRGQRLFQRLQVLGLIGLYIGMGWSVPPVHHHRALPRYNKALTLGPNMEWRFNPLLVDLNKDGCPDLVANARLASPALHMWLGDCKGHFSPMSLPPVTDIGYGALATGDINGDGFPDIVSASHFGRVQTLLSDGKGEFTDRVLTMKDGYAAAQLADINEDGRLELILMGYLKAGLEIYYGDGRGNWTLHSTLVSSKPGEGMPGRALAVVDLNGDGHLDIVAAFQRAGVYVFYGNGRGEFKGGPVDFPSDSQEFRSVAVADVNRDGHPDIVINGTYFGSGKRNGPDVYLGDGRGGWRRSSSGLKVLQYGMAGVAVGDLDGDGNPDIVAGGSLTGDPKKGNGLFLFKGNGKGDWHLVQNSGLPTSGLLMIHSITFADVDGDGVPEILVLTGGAGRSGEITIWKRGKGAKR